MFIGPCIILRVEERETNLMSLALLFHYLMPNTFRMLIHPSSGACDMLCIYFMCCIALVRCVLVLRCGLAGVVWCGILMHSQASATCLYPGPAQSSPYTHIPPPVDPS